ncbi:hypothetical protein ACFWCQ_32830 [Streptomyces cyaneofuscatus]|uniref:hypothetical protein n=1 Tax=Streptomyces cyaneofuscatus TaxID=66883 RepID=UPI00365CBCDA
MAAKGSIPPYRYFGGTANGTPIRDPLEVEKSELDIRCDSEGPNAGTGCVFSGYDPTYVMDSKKFPGAAAHIDMIWRKTNLKWGKAGSGKPLTYLGNKMAGDGSGKTQQDRNRQPICGRQWKTYRDTGLFSDLWSQEAGAPRTDSKSCDEFARRAGR